MLSNINCQQFNTKLGTSINYLLLQRCTRILLTSCLNKIKAVKGQWANNYNYNSNPRGTNLPSSTSQDSEAEQTQKMTSVITTWKKEKENSACSEGSGYVVGNWCDQGKIKSEKLKMFSAYVFQALCNCLPYTPSQGYTSCESVGEKCRETKETAGRAFQLPAVMSSHSTNPALSIRERRSALPALLHWIQSCSGSWLKGQRGKREREVEILKWERILQQAPGKWSCENK